MSNTEPHTPRALFIHAHPEPASFTSAQQQVAAAALREAGWDTTVVDLYAEGWEPVLRREEFPDFDGPFKPQAQQQLAVERGGVPVDVRVQLDAVLAADLLVLSFPLWWFSVPAILKGWVDRVFVMGAVFGGEHGIFEQAALQGRRAVVLATTGGAPAAFSPDGDFGDLERFFFHVHRGMFEFVGYEPLPPVVTHRPARLDDAERTAALAQVRERFGVVAALARPACAATT